MTTNISLYTQGSHQSNNKLFQLNNFITQQLFQLSNSFNSATQQLYNSATQQLSNSFNSATLLTQQLSNSITQQLYTMNSKDYIYKLIEEGEHQQQDFKFEISDARKIAKSLSAFSNTDGGRLLIGVKDNGKIAGVRSEEEIYMIEAAAKLYCQPQVNCQMQIHDIDGHTVLEVIVPPGTTKPYYAKDQTNKCWAYIRIKDENILATPVHLKVWQQEGTPKGSFLHYTEQERLLLDYLTTHPAITLNQYCRLARIPRIKAENTLAKFIRFELIEPIFENHRFYFRGCT